MNRPWRDSNTEPPPMDGTPVLVYRGDWTAPFSLWLAPVVGVYGVFHPNAPGKAGWRTVDGRKMNTPRFWMPLPPARNEEINVAEEPTKWRVVEKGYSVKSFAVVDSGGANVCCGISPKSGAAKLISVAPELLTAIKPLLSVVRWMNNDPSHRGKWDEEIVVAEAVIKKAEGE